MNILIIEDNRQERALLRATLATIPSVSTHRVEEADRLAAAVSCPTVGRFDARLLGIDLPNPDGSSTNLSGEYRRAQTLLKRKPLAARLAIVALAVITVLASSLVVEQKSTWAEVPPSPMPEYAVKAAYLYQFSRFTAWPASAMGNPDASVSLCILGTNPFSTELDALTGKFIHQHGVSIKLLTQIPDTAGCLILFISQSQQPRLQEILATVKNHSMLTVSDIEGFAQMGGMIEFVPEGATIRFAINTRSSSTAGISLSSKLLRLAIHVE